MSAADMEAKFNQLLERNAFLEEQLEARTETEAELQRTKDELRGTASPPSRHWLTASR